MPIRHQVLRPTGSGDPKKLPRFLGLTRKGVYGLAEASHLPSIKVGGRLRFDPADYPQVGLCSSSWVVRWYIDRQPSPRLLKEGSSS